VLSLSLFFYFLAVGVSELFLLVLISAWTNWCTRRRAARAPKPLPSPANQRPE